MKVQAGLGVPNGGRQVCSSLKGLLPRTRGGENTLCLELKEAAAIGHCLGQRRVWRRQLEPFIVSAFQRLGFSYGCRPVPGAPKAVRNPRLTVSCVAVPQGGLH